MVLVAGCSRNAGFPQRPVWIDQRETMTLLPKAERVEETPSGVPSERLAPRSPQALESFALIGLVDSAIAIATAVVGLHVAVPTRSLTCGARASRPGRSRSPARGLDPARHPADASGCPARRETGSLIV